MLPYSHKSIPQQDVQPDIIPLNHKIGAFNIRPRNYTRKIALPTIEGIQFEKVEAIISLEAKGNYTCLKFINKREILVSKTLREVEQLLKNDSRFVRIHRSFTINLDYILKYIKGKGGYVVMEDESNVSVSVGKKQALLDALASYY